MKEQKPLDWQEIFYDFVRWGLYTLEKVDMLRFFAQPVWLLLDFWEHQNRMTLKEVNLHSIGVAKTTYVASNLMGDSKSNPRDFLAFPDLDKADSNVDLDQRTIDIFWDFAEHYQELPDNETIPEQVIQAFNHPELMSVLNKGKKNV